MTDENYIDIAIEISKNAKYPYGAIVVKGNKIIKFKQGIYKFSATVDVNVCIHTQN